jgi:hypothetical protein
MTTQTRVTNDVRIRVSLTSVRALKAAGLAYYILPLSTALSASGCIDLESGGHIDERRLLAPLGILRIRRHAIGLEEGT